MISFFTVKACFCTISERSDRSFFPHSIYLHASPSQTVFDYLSRRHNNSAVSSLTSWTIFWLAKTSNKSISLTTRLAVNPNL